jgi:hypothetical protein
LPLRLFKTDGDAWYKQFFRRLARIADGVASWPDFDGDPAILKMFHDFRLQFGDDSAAHRAYRVCYMAVWLALQDASQRPAKDPAVRAWQKLQLEMMEAVVDVDGFIDDFMAIALAGEDWELLAPLFGAYGVNGHRLLQEKDGGAAL